MTFIPKNKANRNEADTRADLIDPQLKSDGWGLTAASFIRREVICPGRILTGGKRSQPVNSDYVLVYKGRKLAAIEAKKEALSYTEGVRQAKDYAQRLQCRLAYATNGHEIYQIDMVTGEEQLVERYLSPDELWSLTFSAQDQTAPDYKKAWRERFAAIPFELKGDWQPRYYQENAINNALEAIAEGKQKILLTLATGTGKTCIAFQTAWKLFQSRWSLTAQKNPELAKRRPRILFLADRNILANQAFNDFGPFGEDALVRINPDEIRKKGSVPKNASVFFTIFQTFMSGPNKDAEESEEDDVIQDEDAYFKHYRADFFDLIIIDECHRGGANDEGNWRNILNHFSPAVQLGLTATPKRTDNVDTYNYFGEPVYSYTLKQGINDGFLTPFKVYPIVGTMDEYVYTPGDGVVVSGEPEPGGLYKEGDFNRIITIPEREQKRVQYWMDLFKPNEKTIVFCATQEHAGMVRDFINQYAKQKGWTTNTNYCVRVTANDGAGGENDLKIFQDNEKTIPTVLTTSRKLSTGVDARNVRNIVLMRPCNNMIEFKQIVGRGTRMYEGKDYFTIYDFVKAHYNFADPDWDGEPITNIGECKGPQPPKNLQNKNKEIIDIGLDINQVNEPKEKVEKITIQLNDGKIRQIKHISSTLYLLDGTPTTAQQFVIKLFGELPKLFANEDELRAIWSVPSTRKKLMTDLNELGYDKEKLGVLGNLIQAENSDIYDVLAYIAYARDIKTREERAKTARELTSSFFSDKKQQDFINFVLDTYVQEGVEELSLDKIPDLLRIKYQSIPDAVNELGATERIRNTFIGFQKYLYMNDKSLGQ